MGLVCQYRYTIGDYIYEFPAGLVEPNEEFHEGAVREMRILRVIRRIDL